MLPRVHGSAVFTRGETQSMCTRHARHQLRRAARRRADRGVQPEVHAALLLPELLASVKCGPIRGPGRREIGHGALAERSLIAVLPGIEQFPYTVRVISDILESNGSSSMASSCGGCLALMDAGVPITKPVAGISIGLVQEGEKYELLTDIIGEEDHFGDMDFKVCGTRDGITAIQLDIKTEGITHKIIRDTLHRAKAARLVILEKMAEALPAPRPEISKWAPRLLTVKIDPEKIGKLIGPGGKNIKALQAETGCQIDIEDDGTVYIASTDAAGRRAVPRHRRGDDRRGEGRQDLQRPGRQHQGLRRVRRDRPGNRRPVPRVSELSSNYVDRVTDVVNIGDEIKVKVILIDDSGPHQALPQGGDEGARRVRSRPAAGRRRGWGWRGWRRRR